jgi:quercetin dioxygenase-like cupin family protein
MTKHLTIQASDGASYFVIGDVITFKITGDDTQGGYFVVEVTSQPGGGPSFLHTHKPQETFYVLEGSFEVYGQDEKGEKYAIRAAVGDIVHVPGKMPHGFKNVGSGIGRMILTYEPAEPMRNFFQEIGIPMKDRHTLPAEADPRDKETILAILKKHMQIIEMLG